MYTYLAEGVGRSGEGGAFRMDFLTGHRAGLLIWRWTPGIRYFVTLDAKWRHRWNKNYTMFTFCWITVMDWPLYKQLVANVLLGMLIFYFSVCVCTRMYIICLWVCLHMCMCEWTCIHIILYTWVGSLLNFLAVKKISIMYSCIRPSSCTCCTITSPCPRSSYCC